MKNIRLVLPLILIVALPLAAQRQQRSRYAPGTGNPDERLPVWVFVEKGALPAVTTPLVVYWLPSSAEEMKKSPLLDARTLLQESVQCSELVAVVPPNAAVVEKLGVTGKLPIALLVDSKGNVLRRAENVHGVLRPAAVEQMVKGELNARNDAMYRDITEAKRRAGAGDKETAIRLYTNIWNDRCLFPLAGTEAQTALKALGVTVQEPPPTAAPDPYLTPKTDKKEKKKP